MEIKLSNEQMTQIVSKAILETMPEDQRQLVISKALENLLAPGKGSYGVGGPSQLETAFREAMQHVAIRVVTELLQSEAYLPRIKDVVSAGVEKALAPGENYDKLVEKISDAVCEGLSTRRNY